MNLTRRSFLRSAATAAAAVPFVKIGQTSAYAKEFHGFPFQFTPFTQELPIPQPLAHEVLDPAPGTAAASVGSAAVFHGTAPEFSRSHPTHKADWDVHSLKTHKLEMRKAIHQYVPGVYTECFTYNGTVPGPLIRARFGEPMVVRTTNNLDVETSLHLHGGHTPPHGDGHPVFYVMPGMARDYYYPHIIPRLSPTGGFDFSESPSTMWYHDHGNDVTGHNVAHGLAGMCKFTDPLEENLMATNVLPDADGPYDVPLVLQDQALNADGSIFYDPLDHDGRLGNLFIANGIVQPKFTVERRKYRFRLLDGATARFMTLRLSNGQPFLQLGNDSWLLPNAVWRPEISLSMAKRADVIIDFTNAPNELYLENIMQQTSGRGPDGIDRAKPIRLVKFVVTGTRPASDVTVTGGTPLRPNLPIHDNEITARRTFTFERKNGAWVINGDFYSPFRADAVPRLNTAEEWTLENKSGGWWHPIHIHLEAHQIVQYTGKLPADVWLNRKNDTAILEDNGKVKLRMKFRTFSGPFVFHCHNNEHEDMRMMKNFDPRPAGQPSVLNGRFWNVPQEISGIPLSVVRNNPELFH